VIALYLPGAAAQRCSEHCQSLGVAPSLGRGPGPVYWLSLAPAKWWVDASVWCHRSAKEMCAQITLMAHRLHEGTRARARTHTHTHTLMHARKH
jgi:hypothetical protein